MPGKMCNILHNRLLVNYLLPQDTKKMYYCFATGQ